METGYATLPLDCSDGYKFLVGRFELGSQVRLSFKDRPSASDTDFTATCPLGYVSLYEFRNFLRERTPMLLKTSLNMPDDVECVLSYDGDATVTIDVDPSVGEPATVSVHRSSFDQFAEALVGPVAHGCFFA